MKAEKIIGCLKFVSGLSRLSTRRLRALPIEPKKIVFNNFHGAGLGDHQGPILRELIRRGCGYDYVWLVRDESVAASLPEGVRGVRAGSPEAMREMMTAKLWCSNQSFTSMVLNGLVKRPGQCYLQTFHGSLGIKRVGADMPRNFKSRLAARLLKREASMVDILVANATWEAEFVYRRRFFGFGETKLFGHARNDLFFRDDAELSLRVRSALGLAPEERFILFAPTHRDSGAVAGLPDDVSAVASACAAKFGGKWRAVVRLHPNLRGKAKTLGLGPEVVDATDYPDMQELLAVAGALVSDYSSCMFDFMLSRRPVFVYAPDLADYDGIRGFYYPMSETPFPISKDESELAANVTAFDEQKYRTSVEAFLRGKGCVEDGHATERVCDLIEERMK